MRYKLTAFVVGCLVLSACGGGTESEAADEGNNTATSEAGETSVGDQGATGQEGSDADQSGAETTDKTVIDEGVDLSNATLIDHIQTSQIYVTPTDDIGCEGVAGANGVAVLDTTTGGTYWATDLRFSDLELFMDFENAAALSFCEGYLTLYTGSMTVDPVSLDLKQVSVDGLDYEARYVNGWIGGGNLVLELESRTDGSVGEWIIGMDGTLVSSPSSGTGSALDANAVYLSTLGDYEYYRIEGDNVGCEGIGSDWGIVKLDTVTGAVTPATTETFGGEPELSLYPDIAAVASVCEGYLSVYFGDVNDTGGMQLSRLEGLPDDHRFTDMFHDEGQLHLIVESKVDGKTYLYAYDGSTGDALYNEVQ